MLAPWNILGKCKVDDNQTSIDIYKYDIEFLYSNIALFFWHIPTIRMHFNILIDTHEKTLENKEVVSLEIKARCE